MRNAWQYVLFALAFVAVGTGLFLRSYALLAALAISSVLVAVIADHFENAPSRPYRKMNEQHARRR